MPNDIELIDATLKALVDKRDAAREAIRALIGTIITCNERIAKRLDERIDADAAELVKLAERAAALPSIGVEDNVIRGEG